MIAEGVGRPFGVVGWIAIVTLVAGVTVSVARVYSPSTVDVKRTDAIVVHVGAEGRLDAGLELVESGIAPVLVISAVGTEYDRGDLDVLCEREEPFEVLCPVPESATTIGEARAFGRLAEQRGWDSVAVVSSRDHLTRAHLAVSQCTDAETLPVAADSISGVGTVMKEWLATGATATLWRACW